MYRLASHCGIWNVFWLRSQISREQVDEWMAFDELEPLGNHRLEQILGLLGSNLAFCLDRDIPPHLFVPPTDEQPACDEPMKPEELNAAFSRLAGQS